ncbi:MAG: hypothetical protein AB1609_03945 [Bacillota bacterium]
MAVSSTARAIGSWDEDGRTWPAAAARPPAPAAGVLARPGRFVAGWMLVAALVVIGSTAYLSLLVHMAIMGRYAGQLAEQLEAERRRGEALEVALARETSPERTETAARLYLAMEKPQRVQMLVMSAPGGLARAGRGDDSAAAPIRTARASRAGSEDGGLFARVRTAVGELLARPVALARQLPQWP